MRVPKILYHGTTMLRWNMIKKDGLLRCDMPKTWEAQESLEGVYVYLTTDTYEATIYGLVKSLQDVHYSHMQENMKLNPNYRDSVILGINASKLGDIEIDPYGETEVIKQIGKTKNSQWYRYEISKTKNQNIHWYRYKGDIKLENLFVYGYVPFGNFSSDTINKFMKMNEQQKQIMNWIYRPQSVMKQLSFVKIPKIGIKC